MGPRPPDNVLGFSAGTTVPLLLVIWFGLSKCYPLVPRVSLGLRLHQCGLP